MVLIYLSQSKGEWEWIKPIVFALIGENICLQIYVERPLSMMDDLIPIEDVHILERSEVKIKSSVNFKLLDFISHPSFRRWKRIIYKRYLDVARVRLRIDDETNRVILFKDLANDSKFRRRFTLYLKHRFELRTIIFPHGSEIFLEPFQVVPKRFIADEIWCGSKEISNQYRGLYEDSAIIDVGVPRLYEEYIENSVSIHDTGTVLLVSRGVNNLDTVREDLLECLNDVAAVCVRLNKTLKIKHHPRYPISEISRILSSFEDLNWSIDNMAKVEDYSYVLSMWSTLIVDMKVKGVNVALLGYIFRSTLEWNKDILGLNISAYERNGLCQVVKSQEEIEEFLNVSQLKQDKTSIKFKYSSTKELIKCELLR